MRCRFQMAFHISADSAFQMVCLCKTSRRAWEPFVKEVMVGSWLYSSRWAPLA